MTMSIGNGTTMTKATDATEIMYAERANPKEEKKMFDENDFWDDWAEFTEWDYDANSEECPEC